MAPKRHFIFQSGFFLIIGYLPSAKSDHQGPMIRGTAPTASSTPTHVPCGVGPSTLLKQPMTLVRPKGNAIVMSANPAMKRGSGRSVASGSPAEEKTRLFLHFSYACPEPVLVK